jgi:hypothetical protein
MQKKFPQIWADKNLNDLIVALDSNPQLNFQIGIYYWETYVVPMIDLTVSPLYVSSTVVDDATRIINGSSVSDPQRIAATKNIFHILQSEN